MAVSAKHKKSVVTVRGYYCWRGAISINNGNKQSRDLLFPYHAYSSLIDRIGSSGAASKSGLHV